MVRTVRSSGPLFCRGVPVRGCSGGGGSRLRGIEAELNGGLVGGLPEVREEVTDLLLRGIDDLTGGGLVDGGGHILTESLEAAAQLFQEGGGGNGNFGGHGLLLRGKTDRHRARSPRPSLPLNVGAPERFATPS